ncbi:coiled-coil domain-containing protein [Candidatus Contubernalis alkaliaceticus]|uniref:hypothetical protein n=1 Tax=Candidatus Contubernalis alkaliaceticus TaxID=338645 RepID=UPI001F4C1A55|nr:hypothetical protein [Candidatus Contubernalis alkalaceticus]UNC92451.1 hypothetical protein HUE98_10280 [Candidatus Contubernalis alkalaceticus]
MVKEMALKIMEKIKNIGRNIGVLDEVNISNPISMESKEEDVVSVSSDQDHEEENEKKEDSLNCFPLNDNMDKANLDLVNAVNQILRARQFTQQNLEEIQVRLSHSQNQNLVINKEITLVKGILAQKGKEINLLESKISDKNIKIDSLMEEIRENQSNMSNEIKELHKTIDIEQQKYLKYKEQYEKESLNLIMKLKKRDETIIQLESENNNLSKAFENIRKENKYLLSMINDFTDRMSMSFEKIPGQKSNYEN